MLVSPFEHQIVRASWQGSSMNLKSPYLVDRFVLTINRMKMRRSVFVEIEVDRYSEESAHARHSLSINVGQQLAQIRQRTLLGELDRGFRCFDGLFLDRVKVFVGHYLSFL